MKYKSVLNKIMSADMEKSGFLFSALSTNNFCFQNESGTQQVLIDTEKHGPRTLRFAYQVTGKHYFRFYLKHLNPAFCPVADQTYETKEELEDYLTNVTRDTTRIILPYLNIMEENYVEYEESLSQHMFLNLQERICRFRKEYNFSLQYDVVQLKKLDVIMDSMRSTISDRKKDFYLHEEEFLDLSAYYGELLNVKSHTPGNWVRKGAEPGQFEYVVGPTQYNPLWRTLFAWNFGPEVAQYSLQGYHLKVKDTQS